MRYLGISRSTVQGAKGEEWDSVLHVDLGEILQHWTTHDDEEHRILYVSPHTRAIDELWHTTVGAPKAFSRTRYMSEEVAAHFRAEREAWEVCVANTEWNLRVPLYRSSLEFNISSGLFLATDTKML